MAKHCPAKLPLLIRRIINNLPMCLIKDSTLMCHSVKEADVGENGTASTTWIVTGYTFGSHCRNVAVVSTMLSGKDDRSLISQCLSLVWCHRMVAFLWIG